MKMFSHGAEEGPCGFLRSSLDRAADGRSRGLRVLYARAHAVRCPGCRRYLDSLSDMIGRLRKPEEPADEAAIADLLGRLQEKG